MSAPGTTGDEVGVAQTDLAAGALRLPEVLMQSVTLVAPAIATLFSFAFIVSFAGLSAPLAFLIVMAIALMLAVNLSMLARAFPSAGGYFTYLSRALHPRAGLFAAWVYLLFNPLVPAPILVYMGTVLESELKAKYDFTFPWWLFAALALAVVMFVSYRGIKLSGKALIVLGGLEIGIVMLLALWSAFDPGPGGFNFEPVNPGNIGDVGANGLYLAVVFGIFSITGWEGACPIAEESENPRSTVPRALILSVLITGSILVIATWFLLLGWGTDNVASIASSSQLPPLVLADKYWGSFYWIVLLALVNSTLAVCIASNLVGTRMWYSMGKSGALPKWFAADQSEVQDALECHARAVRDHRRQRRDPHLVVGQGQHLVRRRRHDHVRAGRDLHARQPRRAEVLLDGEARRVQPDPARAVPAGLDLRNPDPLVQVAQSVPRRALQVGPGDRVRVVRARDRRGRGARCHR